MKPLPDHECQLGGWFVMRQAAMQVRDAVFVQEQGFTPQEEYDELDADALHMVIRLPDGAVIATARLLQEPVAADEPPTGRIGRVAVLKEWRGQGWGRMLLLVLQDEALLYLYAYALVSWVKLLPPDQQTEFGAQVIASVLIDVIVGVVLTGGAGLAARYGAKTVSIAKNSEVIGQFVTPQNTEISPSAAP